MNLPVPATKDLRGLLSSEAMKAQFALALPKVLPVERFMRILFTTLNNTPKLAECDRNTVIASCMTAAQLGLEIDPVLGRAYLVPYKGRAQLIVGYRGFIDLAYRSGQLASLGAEVVYEKDLFEYEMGLNPKLRHIPSEDEDRGELRYTYAVAELSNGGKVWRVLNRGDVMRAKRSSQSANSDSSPWKQHEAAMWTKTAVRALAKFLPLSPELRDAVAADEPDIGVQAHAFSAAMDVTGSATVAEDKPEQQAEARPLTASQRINAELARATQEGVPAGVLTEIIERRLGKRTINTASPEDADSLVESIKMAIREIMEK